MGSRSHTQGRTTAVGVSGMCFHIQSLETGIVVCWKNSLFSFPLTLVTHPRPSDKRYVGVSPPLTSSLTPADCPTIQLSSDTIYPESDRYHLSRLSVQSHKTVPTSHTNHKSHFVTYTSDGLARAWFPDPLLGFDNWPEQLTELREIQTFTGLLSDKGHN